MGIRTATRKYKCHDCRFEWVQSVAISKLDSFVVCPNCESERGDAIQEAYGQLDLTVKTQDLKLLKNSLAQHMATLAIALLESAPLTKLLERGLDTLTLTILVGGQHDPGNQRDDVQREVNRS
jgi:DNA-directed RNA polymerase subunit RPC12/RpoP